MARQIRWVHVVRLQVVGYPDMIQGVFPRFPDAFEAALKVAEAQGLEGAGVGLEEPDHSTHWMRVGDAALWIDKVPFNRINGS